MNCHMCGERQATIHLLELVNGEQKSVWLCSICASGRADIPRVDRDGGGVPGDGGRTLASFLGQVYDSERQAVAVPPCPRCGYEIKAFLDGDRLGCPACYLHFRRQVLPILARYHRHASHLGKVPQQAAGKANRQGELTRIRVALEKAIRAENYEEAARLRDGMRRLAAERDGAGSDGGS